MTKHDVIQSLRILQENCKLHERCSSCQCAIIDNGGDYWCEISDKEPHEWNIERLEREGK